MTSAPTPPYDPRDSARTARLIGGGVLATVGAVLALGGGGILALGGSDGEFSSDQRDVSTSTSALVSKVASINDTAEVANALGHPRVKIATDSMNPDRNVFVGVRTESEFAVQVPHLAGAALALLVVGIRVVGGGIVLMAIPSRRRSSTAPPAPSATYAVG